MFGEHTKDVESEEYLTENTKMYLITCLDEDDKLVVSHGVNDYDGRNVCLPCESLDYFNPRVYDNSAGEWFMPIHYCYLNYKLWTEIQKDFPHGVQEMAQVLGLDLWTKKERSGYITFKDSKSYMIFKMKYNEYVNKQ